MMKSKAFSSIILPLSGLIIVLALAYGCDIWVQMLKTINVSTFRFTSILYLSYSLTTLLVAGGLLSLFWVLMTKCPRNFWVGLIYLLVGIFIVSGFSLYYLVPIRIWPLLSLQTILKPSSYMFISGGFIGVTGLMLILVPKKDKV